MALLALVIGLLIMAIGSLGVVLPETLSAAVRYLLTPLGLYLIAAFRVAFGVVLILVAPSSRAPNFLRILGWIVVFAGIATPFIGVDRARAMLDWWSTLDPAVMRAWSGIGAVFGAAVVYAVVPRRRPGQLP